MGDQEQNKTNQEELIKKARQAYENMTKDEKIGYHKGALSVLIKEREEIAKILSIVEQLMKMHIESLKKLGVKLE